MLVSAPGFSLLKVDGAMTGFAKGPMAVGVGLEFPLIPFFPTTLYYHSIGEQKINFEASVYKELTGEVKVKAYALELAIEFPLGFAGVNVGGTVLGDFFTGEAGGKDAILPGSIYSGLFGRYRKALLPFVDLYATLGFLAKTVDGEKEINKKTGVNIDMGDVDKSGLYYRAGLTIGF
jgi:hypothetical protein